MSDPLRVTRLNSQYFNLDLHFGSGYSMKMDDQFIAVKTFNNDATSIHFFSKKMLNLHWQKTVDGDMRNDFVYYQGMFLRYVVKRGESEKFGLIEMFDVTSGKRFREMRIAVNRRYEYIKYRVGFN